MEATIASIHTALAAGQLTSAQLARLYLERIAADNMQGPALHAIITVNPKAMQTAADMDRNYRADSATVGLLRCISDDPQGQLQYIRYDDDQRQYQHDLGATRRRFHGRQDT